jgi:hypothetical protein
MENEINFLEVETLKSIHKGHLVRWMLYFTLGDIIISNSIKRGELAIKTSRPMRVV